MRVTQKKKKASHPSVNVYVISTSNNTKIVATTKTGDVVAWSTSGSVGYEGTKRSTPSAASEAASNLISKLKAFNVQECRLLLKGMHLGRDAAVKTITASGLPVKALYDITPYPFAGCRPKGRRRV